MKLNKKRKGFTLVEIMIVVAIIALLATIAVPNFLRVRKRSQATRILEELRLLEGAKDQWALEKNKQGNSKVTVEDLKEYVKKDATIFKGATDTATTIKDVLGNDITIGNVDEAPQIDKATYDNFTTGDGAVVEAEFWGAYYKTTTTP